MILIRVPTNAENNRPFIYKTDTKASKPFLFIKKPKYKKLV